MLELHEVTYTYPGASVPAVNRLNAVFRRGELMVIMGANGSGKSTMARLLTGLLTPDSGEVCVNGACFDRGPSSLGNLVGLVRQDPRNQLIAALTDEEVAFGPENLALPREEIRRLVKEALKTVGLEGYDNRPPDSLSAGQQQRLAIAGILAMRPQFLIFDEASSMLDPAGRISFYRLCRRLADEGYGVVSISHFPDEALRADRLLLLARGSASDTGEPTGVFQRNSSLPRPFVLSLTEALHRRGVSLGNGASDIRTLAAEIVQSQKRTAPREGSAHEAGS